MTDDDIQTYERLMPVLDAQCARIEGLLAEVLKKEHHMQMHIDFVDGEFEKLAHVGLKSVQASHLLGTHDAWISYNRDQKIALNQQLAKLRAQQLEIRAELRVAAARRDVVQNMIKEGLALRKKTREARRQERILEPFLYSNMSS